MSTQTYLYEIYLKGPQGQEGWTIETGWIRAISLEDAKAFLRALPGFDQFTDCYHAGQNKGDMDTYVTPAAVVRVTAERMRKAKQEAKTVRLTR